MAVETAATDALSTLRMVPEKVSRAQVGSSGSGSEVFFSAAMLQAPTMPASERVKDTWLSAATFSAYCA